MGVPKALPSGFEVVKDAAAAAERTADRFEAAVKTAVAERGRAFVCLAGGSTPRDAYRLLAAEPRRSQVPWERVEVFFGDERCVPPEDEGSNYRMAHDALLSKVPIPRSHVHRIRGEGSPEAAAGEYSLDIVKTVGDPPRFDLVLLGMGPDGHTASLFPGTPALDETRAWVAPNRRPEGRCGVTLTFAAINAARQVIVTATGAAKGAALRRVLEDGPDPLPAARVRPVDGRLTWIIDASLAAAATPRP
jgi:6-phosphogluconolactonase